MEGLRFGGVGNEEEEVRMRHGENGDGRNRGGEVYHGWSWIWMLQEEWEECFRGGRAGAVAMFEDRGALYGD